MAFLKARQEHRVLPIATDYPPLRQTAYGGSRDQPVPGFPSSEGQERRRKTLGTKLVSWLELGFIFMK